MAVHERQRRIAERVGNCCACIWVGRDDEGPCLVVNRCRNRPCPECARINARKHAHHIEARIATWRAPKMVTLTLAPNNLSLRDTLTFLLHSFNRLRQHAVWKAQVRGGIYAVEITRNPHTRRFHVHLHALMDAKYVDQRWLSDTWSNITKGSIVVHIRKAQKSDAKYVAKYVRKTTEQDLQDFEQWPYWEELHGKRMVGAFGNEPPINADPDEEKSSVEPLAPLSDVIAWARAGDPEALIIIEQLVGRYPWLIPDEEEQEE